MPGPPAGRRADPARLSYYPLSMRQATLGAREIRTLASKEAEVAVDIRQMTPMSTMVETKNGRVRGFMLMVE